MGVRVANLLFVLVFVIGIALSIHMASDVYEELREKEQSVLESYSARLDSAVESQVKVAELLGEIIAIYDGQLTDEYFARICDIMYNEYIDPKFAFISGETLTQVYPLEGNEHIIGNNVFEAESSKVDATRAKETRQLVVSGPYELSNGRMGIVIRNPLYNGDHFIGFAVVNIDAQTLFSAIELEELGNLGYEYQLIADYAGTKEVALESDGFDQKFTSVINFEIAGQDWQMSLYIKNRNELIVTQASFWFFAILIVNCILYYIIRRLQKNRIRMAKKMETDALTGAYNRMKLSQSVKELKHTPFALFFIDLNKFKPVNDTYGHDMGDKLLIAYVKRLKWEMKSDTIIARVGGDEFVLVMPGVVNEEEAESIKRRIRTLSENQFTLDSVPIHISASVGSALSSEAPDLETLLTIADEKMYAEKKHNQVAR